MIIQTRWTINILQSLAFWDLQTHTHADTGADTGTDTHKHILFSHKHTVGPLPVLNRNPRQIIQVHQKDIAEGSDAGKKKNKSLWNKAR